jgi:diguanylate cyclase
MPSTSPVVRRSALAWCCWDGQEISEELVARADRALYQAKDAGRDRIVAAGQHLLESR